MNKRGSILPEDDSQVSFLENQLACLKRTARLVYDRLIKGLLVGTVIARLHGQLEI